jgi:HAUS augmin-like complex subunit 6 N-terminus
MVLRKTMLDECKGERFEELLAVFAAVVLKKTLLHKDADFKGLARRLATATCLTAEEQSLLKPLAIAHRASLANRLREREEMKERYEDFAGLLELKRRQVVRREEELRLSTEERKDKPIISDEEGRALKRQWQEYWVGDEAFLDIVIDGDVRYGMDALLSKQYSLIWEKVEDGMLGEVEDMRGKTLLEDLDERIRDHKIRLERWKVFNGDFCKQVKEERRKSKVISDSSKRKQGFNLSFEDHKELVPGSKSALKYMPAAKSQVLEGDIDDTEPDHEYKRLMHAMQAELAKVGRSRRNGGAGWRRDKRDNIMDFGSKTEKDEDTSETAPELPNTIHHGEGEASSEEGGIVDTTVSQPSDTESQTAASSNEGGSLDDQATLVIVSSKATPGGTAAEISKLQEASFALPGQQQKRPKNTRLSLLDPEEQELLADQVFLPDPWTRLLNSC